MQDILYLTHRIPYPPNKGDKIRSWHLLKFLSKRYRVHLGTFIDDPDDLKYVDTVKALCADMYFVELGQLGARLKSLTGLLTGKPLTQTYYQDSGMQRWVDYSIYQHKISRAIVFSSGMAQFVANSQGVRRIIDFVDIDSDKWRQYSEEQAWPMNAIYGRESRVLQIYERKICREFDASLFVSEAESDLFKQIAPESVNKIGFFNNGVDTDYFTPHRDYSNPYPNDHLPIVFTGAMDYWPNVDAVQWYAQEVLPGVRREHPNAHFYIVGSRPNNAVLSLGQKPGVTVTGGVPDIRPYLAHACFAVAPLRVARGVQNKVLEAMAMAVPIVVTPQAFEGIDAEPKEELLLAREPEQFFYEACDLFSEKIDGFEIGRKARERVVTQYGWDSNLACVEQLLEGGSLSS